MKLLKLLKILLKKATKKAISEYKSQINKNNTN